MISDGVSLSDKVGREDGAFVSEQGAFDTFLLRQSVIDIFSPNKDGISSRGSQDNIESGADELISRAAVFVFVGAVMSLI
jgi:hypothetical protein